MVIANAEVIREDIVVSIELERSSATRCDVRSRMRFRSVGKFHIKLITPAACAPAHIV